MLSRNSLCLLFNQLEQEKSVLWRARQLYEEVAQGSWTADSRESWLKQLFAVQSAITQVASHRVEVLAVLSAELGCPPGEVCLTRIVPLCPEPVRGRLEAVRQQLRSATVQAALMGRTIGYLLSEWEGIYVSILNVFCGSEESERYGATGKRCLSIADRVQDVRT